MSQKFPYMTHYSVGTLKTHSNIKHELLDLIDSAEVNEIRISNEYYADSMSRLDWYKNNDGSRPWVQYFSPILGEYLAQEAKERNMEEVDVTELWFQQYFENDTHGWHVHGENYTGVYYLEMPESTPRTQMITETGELFTPSIKEGDVLIFPSFVSHRAPPNISSERKTIISFNMSMNKPIGLYCP